MYNPIILYRIDKSNLDEYKECSKIFLTRQFRGDIKSDDLVVPRYSSLPYYRELEYDVWHKGAKLIQSYEQHRWIADARWTEHSELFTHTPKTYDEIHSDQQFYNAPEGQYIVKGRTNSRKLNWNKKMLANSKREALEIAGELLQDPLIAEQGIIYREYIPLQTWEVGANGLPFTNEWRFFFLGENLIDYGYYWAIAQEETIQRAKQEPILPFWQFARKIAKIVAKKTNFFVLDIAKTAAGDIILVEINCGTMSGLAEIPADRFYRNLKNVLQGNSQS